MCETAAILKQNWIKGVLILVAAIRFESVEKRFGSSGVFAGLDLEVAAGGFFGLAGVNGAGKTTLIKCLLDFCALDAGRIEIFGASHLARGARSRLAYLPERFSPPGYLKGGEFLDQAMRLQGRRPDRAAIRAMLEDLDLGHDALQKPVRLYSKGMTQKLGLAACLLGEKDLLVLDEPMSGLDPRARALVKRKLESRRGMTLLFTSHSLADMAELCDTMAVLHDGRLAYSGSPAELGPSPEQAFLDMTGASGCTSIISA